MMRFRQHAAIAFLLPLVLGADLAAQCAPPAARLPDLESSLSRTLEQLENMAPSL